MFSSVNGLIEIWVQGEDEAEVQVDEQGLVEVQVQGEDEASVIGCC